MATLTPSQCRAGRALLNLSRAEFGQIAGINERTVAAVELGENAPSRATAMRMTAAFLRLGVEMVPEDAGRGAGVRLMEPEGGTIVLGRHLLKGSQEIGVVLRVAGRPMTARVEITALTAYGDTTAALEEFDCRRVAIAGAIAKKLEAQAYDADGHLRVAAADFETRA